MRNTKLKLANIRKILFLRYYTPKDLKGIYLNGGHYMNPLANKSEVWRALAMRMQAWKLEALARKRVSILLTEYFRTDYLDLGRKTESVDIDWYIDEVIGRKTCGNWIIAVIAESTLEECLDCLFIDYRGYVAIKF